jgi:cytoskeletal protein RodZ
MSDTQVESEQQTKKETQGSLGSLLRSYREQNGHDIYEVAEALCLSPEIVNSLEEEKFDSLPEPPYVRGYLRSYAKFANIDPQKIIDLYEEQRGADPRDLEYHFKPSSSGNLAKPAISASAVRLGLIALLLVGLAALSMIPAVNSWITETWAGFSKQTADKNYASATPVAAENQFTIPAPLPGEEETTEQATGSTESSDSNTAENTTGQNPKNSNKQGNADKKGDKNNNPDEKEQDATTDAAKTDEKAEDDKEGVPETKDGTKLKFVFKKEVWMRIKDKKKKTIFESLSPAGEEKEVRLKKPMTFRIGNAQGVEIYVEGKRLDITAFTKGSVANFTIE